MLVPFAIERLETFGTQLPGLFEHGDRKFRVDVLAKQFHFRVEVVHVPK